MGDIADGAGLDDQDIHAVVLVPDEGGEIHPQCTRCPLVAQATARAKARFSGVAAHSLQNCAWRFILDALAKRLFLTQRRKEAKSLILIFQHVTLASLRLCVMIF
jgi:hypothetical protein